MSLEEAGIPTVALHTNVFARLAKATALANGMPTTRQAYVPQPVVDRLTKETAAFLEDPETKKYFQQQFIVAAYKNPTQFQQYIKTELERWANVVKTAGIKAE